MPSGSETSEAMPTSLSGADHRVQDPAAGERVLRAVRLTCLRVEVDVDEGIPAAVNREEDRRYQRGADDHRGAPDDRAAMRSTTWTQGWLIEVTAAKSARKATNQQQDEGDRAGPGQDLLEATHTRASAASIEPAIETTSSSERPPMRRGRSCAGPGGSGGVPASAGGSASVGVHGYAVQVRGHQTSAPLRLRPMMTAAMVLTPSVITKSTKPAARSADSWAEVESPNRSAMSAETVWVPISSGRILMS